MNDVLEDVRRITAVTERPLLVDADTGWGSAFNIARTTREMIRAGAAAMHIEDQEQAKRCGHRPNKATVPVQEMCDRLKAAVDARTRRGLRDHGSNRRFCARRQASVARSGRRVRRCRSGHDLRGGALYAG